MSKGTWTLLLSLGVAAGGMALALTGWDPAGVALACVGGSALVGAFTNRMAINALFSPWPFRRFALPYTGLIERNRERITGALADAVSESLITPESLSQWIRDSRFLENLRDGAAAHVRSLGEPLDADGAATVEKLTAALRTRVGTLLRSGRTYFRVRGFLRRGGKGMKLLHVTGLGDYDELTYRILDAVEREVGSALDLAAEQGGQFGAVLDAAAGRLERWDIRSCPAVEKFVGYVVSEFDVRDVVVRSLNRFSAREVKELVHSLSRRHLAWLEVWGGVLGAAFGGGLWLLSRAAAAW